MKRSRLTGLATLILAAALVAGRSSAEEADARVAVALSGAEKAFVLGQMRLFVESVQEIVVGLAADDRAAVAEAAAARGARRFQAEGRMPTTLGPKFPEGWTAFGRPMRAGFDELAKSVAAGEGKDRSLARLGEVMRNCVGCHSAYRIVDEQK